MKVPMYIKAAIRESGELHHKALQADNLVREWMKKNNLHNDYNLDQYIDSCEMGTNQPESFIAFLIKNDVEIGNNEDR